MNCFPLWMKSDSLLSRKCRKVRKKEDLQYELLTDMLDVYHFKMGI